MYSSTILDCLITAMQAVHMGCKLPCVPAPLNHICSLMHAFPVLDQDSISQATKLVDSATIHPDNNNLDFHLWIGTLDFEHKISACTNHRTGSIPSKVGHSTALASNRASVNVSAHTSIKLPLPSAVLLLTNESSFEEWFSLLLPINIVSNHQFHPIQTIQLPLDLLRSTEIPVYLFLSFSSSSF